MAKAKTIYACTECGASASKWQGQCPGCGVWNTLVETVEETSASSGKRFAALSGTSRLQVLAEIEAREEDRLPTGISDFDRALGGGLVAGGVVKTTSPTSRRRTSRIFRARPSPRRAGHLSPAPPASHVARCRQSR